MCYSKNFSSQAMKKPQNNAQSSLVQLNQYNADIFLYKLQRQKGFFNLKSSEMSQLALSNPFEEVMGLWPIKIY